MTKKHSSSRLPDAQLLTSTASNLYPAKSNYFATPKCICHRFWKCSAEYSVILWYTFMIYMTYGKKVCDFTTCQQLFLSKWTTPIYFIICFKCLFQIKKNTTKNYQSQLSYNSSAFTTTTGTAKACTLNTF